jgi:hypothetical protein
MCPVEVEQPPTHFALDFAVRVLIITVSSQGVSKLHISKTISCNSPLSKWQNKCFPVSPHEGSFFFAHNSPKKKTPSLTKFNFSPE